MPIELTRTDADADLAAFLKRCPHGVRFCALCFPEVDPITQVVGTPIAIGQNERSDMFDVHLCAAVSKIRDGIGEPQDIRFVNTFFDKVRRSFRALQK
jgi:hypothetical protein